MRVESTFNGGLFPFITHFLNLSATFVTLSSSLAPSSVTESMQDRSWLTKKAPLRVTGELRLVVRLFFLAGMPGH
jgi:hypothetical protein